MYTITPLFLTIAWTVLCL